MTIREFIESMKQRPYMDHKDVRIALSADEWGTGDYADWRQLFVTMVRDTDVPETIDGIKKELKIYRESIYDGMSNANVKKFRWLSPKFMQDLQGKGLLFPLKDLVNKDNSVSLEIRNNYINIYYRGGSLLKLSKVKEHTYKPFFEIKYADEKDTFLNRLPTAISSSEDLNRWLENFPLLKSIMDSWFLKHPKLEREFQQMVIWENNNSSIASATDYFIADIEYDNRKGGRFDMVAIQWDSDTTARKLQSKDLPKLCFIEMKYGDAALNRESGMIKHVQQWKEYLTLANIKEIKSEMLTLFKQKRELGLIGGLKGNRNNVENLSDEIDCIFLLANHDPSSQNLKKIMEKIKLEKITDVGIKFCASNFMGYGLFKENVYTIAEFQKRYEKQIYSNG